ncbi:MAG: NAD(P)H:quinone oxidoreductase [Geminicoccaceae bacterium]|nr:NAD(P)H:quinone oxidoreductase [Geminicoccaceae bacterium]
MATRVLVLYYSTYGHVETMAWAVAEGAGSLDGVEVTVKRVPETVPEDVAKQFHFKLDQKAPIATPQELPDYDAILVGCPTRYGGMASQMRAFWDQTGSLWAQGALIGKVASMFTASASQHGGNETTIVTALPLFLHHGMIYVGLPYSCQEQLTLDEITGGSPYGATTIAGGQGQRQPSEKELAMARFQGRHVAEIARKLKR